MNRGVDGAALPDEAVVIRMCYGNRITRDLIETSGSGALAVAFSDEFVLSSLDKQQIPPHLSVYEESLTTLVQARQLTGGDKNLALRLPVNSVRGLNNPNCPDQRINVCWYQGLVFDKDQYIPDNRAGSEGHCGITGLLRPARGQKEHWKWFRVKLADIAIANDPVYLS